MQSLYESLRVPTDTELLEFWSSPGVADLLACLFPAVKREDGIANGFPAGGFHPDHQKLSLNGLEQLISYRKTPRSYAKIDGIKSYNSARHEILGGDVCGGAIKPVGRKIVVLDFDMRVAHYERVLDWIANLEDCLMVRGNRSRVTIVFRQSDCFTQWVRETRGNRSKFVIPHTEDDDAKLEIAIGEGASNNVFGLHKSGKQYQCAFPSEIGEMTRERFHELIEILKAEEFRTSKVAYSCAENRVMMADIESQYACKIAFRSAPNSHSSPAP